MKPQILVAALAGTLILCAVVAVDDDDIVQASAPNAAGGTGPADRRYELPPMKPAALRQLPTALERDAWPEVAALALQAWASAEAASAASVAPPAAPKQQTPATSSTQAPLEPIPPPTPKAPASGFELLGTVVEGGFRSALIQTSQRSLWVRSGDTIDGAWRIEEVRADSVSLLWLPQQLPAALRYRAP